MIIQYVFNPFTGNLDAVVPGLSSAALVGEVTVLHKNGTTTAYNPATNTDAARGAALLAAFAAAVDGDLVYLVNGTFDLGNNGIDLTLGNTGVVSIFGSGKYTTIIKSSVSQFVINAASASTASDLSIIVTSTGATFTLPWGNETVVITNAILRNVYISGRTDGIYFQNHNNPGKVIAWIYNCDINTNWDVVFLAESGTINVYDTTFNAVAISSVNSQLFAYGPHATDGLINLYNCQMSASGGTSNNFAVFSEGGSITVNGGSAASSGTSSFDLFWSGGGSLSVSDDVSYDPNKTAGTITHIGSVHRIAGTSGNVGIMNSNNGDVNLITPNNSTTGGLPVGNVNIQAGADGTNFSVDGNVNISTTTGGGNVGAININDNAGGNVNVSGNLNVIPNATTSEPGFFTSGLGALENSLSFGIGNWMESPNSAAEVFAGTVGKASVFALSTRDASSFSDNPWGAVVGLLANTANTALITSIIGTQFGVSGQPVAIGVDKGGDGSVVSDGALVGSLDWDATRDAQLQITGGVSVVGKYIDNAGSVGTSGQVLTSTGSATAWGSPSSVVGSADLTAQSAAKTATTIFTPSSTGLYRISVYLQITTAASTSSVLGGASGVVVSYTDGDGSVAQTDTVALMNPSGGIAITSAVNTTATNLNGTMVINAKTGIAIQYAIGYTSVGVTPMQYAAHLKVEKI